MEEEWSVKSKKQFLKIFKDKMKFLAENPLASKMSDVRPGLRSLVLNKQNALLYTIHDQTIIVVTIFDARQDPNLLKEEIKQHFGDFSND